jgi:hypothetical protein
VSRFAAVHLPAPARNGRKRTPARCRRGRRTGVHFLDGPRQREAALGSCAVKIRPALAAAWRRRSKEYAALTVASIRYRVGGGQKKAKFCGAIFPIRGIIRWKLIYNQLFKVSHCGVSCGSDDSF